MTWSNPIVSRTLPMLLAVHVAMLSLGGGAKASCASPETPQSNPIKLGMSTAMTGPAMSLGLNMKLGVEAALEEANRSGGIGGRQLMLIALDDGYEPTRTAPNMHTLIENEQVLAVVGNVGTPTAVTAVPIASERRTPFYGAFTGAGILRRTPPDRYVINYRASYAQETAAMVDALIEHGGLAPNEIGFFTQRDAYGDAGYSGGLAALRRHGLSQEKSVAHGRYMRNTLAIENGLADILQAQTQCKAVIMVGAYAPCAKFITMAQEFGLEALFLNVSFVGAVPLAEALGEAGDGVIITQVVPPPQGDTPLAREYRDALRQFAPDASPTHGSFEGYIATRILIQAMRSIQGDPDRESIVNALESLGEFELEPGLSMSLSPEDHQASDKIWASIIDKGEVKPLNWPSLAQQSAADKERP